MRARPEKGQRRVAYQHHSFPLLPGKWLQGKWGGRDGQQYARDIASGTHPNPLALCLFQRPTRLADGFGLKETTLPATGRIHPGKWVPRSPKWGFGPRTPTLLFCRDCGERTFDPRVGCLEEDWRALGSARLLCLPSHLAAGLPRGCAACCGEIFSPRPAARRMHQQGISYPYYDVLSTLIGGSI